MCGRVQINLDVTVHRLGCASISLDAMDVSGDNHLDVVTNIFKRRLHADGRPKELVRPQRCIVFRVCLAPRCAPPDPSLLSSVTRASQHLTQLLLCGMLGSAWEASASSKCTGA